jgi:hypothetical protein
MPGSMSAISSPAPIAAPRPTVPAGLVAAGRTIALVALVLFVPGEAARIGADVGPRRD